MITLIDPATHVTAPWKNGGGTATDFAVRLGPDGDVDWRIGTAAIEKDGPFSHYPDVTRVFTVVEGPGVHLDFSAEGTRTLDRDQPTRFAGAPGPFCRLRGAPATAFNLLMRDGAFSGDVQIVTGGEGVIEPNPSDVLAFVALEGDWQLTGEGLAPVVIRPWFTALLEGRGLVQIAAGPGARAALVLLNVA
ncbi:HutD family protein [Phreatobacter aquaticus]|uniref:HutD family protein n=1 Tax=Phreatobacter aquaticus TaxID=2570229 RepID=A0A4D7QL92_9HYPH|nr:HutD family protein [Phreatobacter aquaticus]QCK88388.1 HutD family protein [Phreatobacter aquaticus]